MSAVYPITAEGAIRWSDWTVIVRDGGQGWTLYRIGVAANGVRMIQHDGSGPFVHDTLDTARARANILNGAS